MMVGPIETMSISGYGFKQTTFQARVDNLDVRRLVEQALISFTYQMHHRRISVRLPARYAPFASVFAPASLPSESSMLTT